MLKIKISNSITIEQPPTSLLVAVKKSLTIDNPAYHKNKRMGIAVWDSMRYFKYYRVDKAGTLYCPRGFRSRLLAWCDKTGLEYEVEEFMVENRLKEIKSSVKLRANQNPLVDQALTMREGIVHGGTGIGKSIVAVEMIARLGLTATVIVKNTTLLDNFRIEIKRFLGIDCGIVGSGRKDIQPITVTTIQSLQADENMLRLLASNTSILFVDECQEFVTPKRMTILRKFRPKYMYGLTATPTRSKDDGRGRAVKFVFGECTDFVETESMKPTVTTVRSNVNIDVDDYHRIIDNVVENEDRNNIIAGLIMDEVINDRKVLVLTKRRHHGDLLYWKMPSEWQNDKVFLIDSDDKDRNALIRQFKQSERDYSVIIGTTSLLAVGTDIPSLDTLILACDMKSDVLTVQSVGRVLRLHERKKQPNIIDICDNKNPILWRQYKERQKVYRERGWIIKN